MIRGIIFDLGNTLMHFDGEWEVVTQCGVEGLRRHLREQGIDLAASFGADFVETRRAGRERSVRTDVEYTATQALCDTLARYGFPNVPDETIASALAVFFTPELERWVPYPDAHATLEELCRRGFHLGLISNATDDAFIQYLVRREGWSELLKPSISSAALPWRKPDPRIFEHVLDEWKFPAADVVMVGDWPGADILGAHRAGMRAILLDDRWPEPPHLFTDIPDQPLLEADAIVRDLSDIIPVLDRFNSKA